MWLPIDCIQEDLYLCVHDQCSRTVTVTNMKTKHHLMLKPNYIIHLPYSYPTSIRYLIGVYITSATVFLCSVSHNKQATYRTFNAIFGKVGRAASAEVMIQLFNSKCLSILYYGIDVCPLTSTQINSLQFVVNSCYRKIFYNKFHWRHKILPGCIWLFTCFGHC